MAFDVMGAKQAGYTDQEIQQYLASKGQPSAAPAPQPEQAQGGGLADWLPTIGAIAGGFTPLGPIFGSGVGAAVGTGAKQLFQGKPDVGEIAKEGAFAGLGAKYLPLLFKGGAKLLGRGAKAAETVGERTFPGATGGAAPIVEGQIVDDAAPKVSNIFTKAGQKVEDFGKDIGIKGLRLNPGQITKFTTRHRQDPADFLSAEGAIGKGSAAIRSQHIEPIQNEFNTIAKNSGLVLDRKTIINNIEEAIKELVDAGGSENRKLAIAIQKEMYGIMGNDLAPAGFAISKADQLRRTFASKVNWNDPQKGAFDYIISDILRKSNIDTAAQAGMPGLDQLGIRLSKFRDLDRAIIAQEALGRGAKPSGITNWLSVLAGAQFGGAGGMMGGLAANQLLSNPAFLKFASRAATGAGKGIGGIGEKVGNIPMPSNLLERTGGALGAATGGGPMVTEAQAAETNQPGGDLISLAADQGQGQSADADMRKLFLAMMLSNPKQAATLKTIFDFGFPKSTVSANQEKGYQKIADAESIAKQIEQEFKKVGGSGRVTGRVQELGGVLGINPQTTTYNALREASIGPLARAISAEVGVLTDRDIARAEKLLPKITDTSQEAKLKIKLLHEAIKARRENIGNTPKSTETSIPLPANLGL